MASLARTVDAERLLAQAGWVRAIVRGLVLDETQVEDVLQDTWVAALERAPGERRLGAQSTDERGGVRAWLAAVARNLALRRRRREAVRAAIERAAARPERTDGGQGEVERMQLQRALADAVLALEEPYRSAVILRHLDGLSANEIARRQGCTSATARQRVSRGLAQLRVRLAERFGRDAEGQLALVAWLGRGLSPSLITGGVLVSTKLVLGAACAVLAAVALWMATSDGRGRGEPATAKQAEHVASPVSERREGASALRRDGIASASAPLATAEGTAREPLAEHAPAAAPETLVAHGHITDTHGRPLDNAELLLVGEQRPVEATSNDDGEVTLDLDFALRAPTQRVRASCDGHVPRELELDLGVPFTIELASLPALEGRVLDPEGRPVAPPGYVKVHVIDAGSNESRESETELAPDGTYRLAHLPLGRLVSVEARARGFAAAELPEERELEPDRTLALDVELPRGAVVTGTVLDARTHEPVPGATVWMESFEPDSTSVHPVTTADEKGRFRIAGANEDVEVSNDVRVAVFWLLARADGFASAAAQAYVSQTNDAHAYDFEMLLEPAGCSLRVEVVFADGKPASGATVWAIDALANPLDAVADAEGVHEFEALPAGTLGLWLASAGEGTGPGDVDMGKTRGVHALRAEVTLEPGEARSERFVLRPPGKERITGRVLDVQGHGVPDFEVHAQLEFELNGLRIASGSDEARTDGEGRYAFEGLQPGKYQVWANGEGTALGCAQPHDTYVDVEEDRATEVMDLVVGTCLTLEGRIETELDLAALELAARDPLSGVDLAGTRPAKDGSFRFDPLVAREYEVVLVRDGKVLDRTSAGPANASGLFLRAR